MSNIYLGYLRNLFAERFDWSWSVEGLWE